MILCENDYKRVLKLDFDKLVWKTCENKFSDLKQFDWFQAFESTWKCVLDGANNHIFVALSDGVTITKDENKYTQVECVSVQQAQELGFISLTKSMENYIEICTYYGYKIQYS